MAMGQRTREFGIRMALGARKNQILWQVARTGVRCTVIGALIGTATAFVVPRLLSSFLYRVELWDVGVYLGASAFLVVVALLASWYPARAAALVDPAVAIRSA